MGSFKQPGADGEALAEGEVEWWEVWWGWGQRGGEVGGFGGVGGVGWGKDDVSMAFLLRFGAVDEVGDFGCAGIYGGEGEDIKKEYAAVVEEVAEGFLDELVVGVGEKGDLLDGVDAIDVREDEEHG